jgi:hypothetical protein
MYVVETRMARARKRAQAELDGVIKWLTSKEYVPVLRSGAVAILTLCGIPIDIYAPETVNIILRMFPAPPEDEAWRASALGDIFGCGDSILALQPGGWSSLDAWEIREHTNASHLSEFCEVITEAAKATIDGRRLRGMNFDWTRMQSLSLAPFYKEPFEFPSRRPARGDLSTRSPELSEQAGQEANLLVNREAREFLMRLAKLGKARSADVQTVAPAKEVDALFERGLIRKEFLVQCRADSRTLCTVQTRDQLLSKEGNAIRCTNCGRSFSEELIQEIYALTDRARFMINGSHWMTIWITSLLVNSGLGLDKVLWGGTAGEDEIDIIAIVYGQRIFFELKDREFGLGDAYPFIARVQRYGASAGVIISMDGVAQAVQEFLRGPRGPLDQSFYTISGAEEAEMAIPIILTERSKMSAIYALGEAFSSVNLDFAPILNTWFERRAST